MASSGSGHVPRRIVRTRAASAATASTTAPAPSAGWTAAIHPVAPEAPISATTILLHAGQLIANQSRIPEPIPAARPFAAAAAGKAYGEPYLADRLLADLLPFLDADLLGPLARDVGERLEAMGAAASAGAPQSLSGRSGAAGAGR